MARVIDAQGFTMEASSQQTVADIVASLRAGEVVVLPTDTVYGLAADPTNPDAMQRLFEIKERPGGVPIAVLLSSIDQARALIEWSEPVDALATAHWPGALTIVGAAGTSELHLGSIDTIGVRVPDNDLIRACAAEFGPIGCTSANRHGEPTVVEPDGLVDVFGDRVELIVGGGALDGVASTVVDATADPLRVLRQGMVHLDQ